MDIKDHILSFFEDVSFEESTHTYKYKEKVLPISVSGIVGTLYNTDAEELARNYAFKHGVNKELVLKEWNRISKEATDYGTEVHLFGENIARVKTEDLEAFDNNLLKDEPKKLGVLNYEKEVRSRGFKPLLEELSMVFLDKNGNPIFGGTFDRLYVKDKSLLKSDYKTNKELKSYSFRQWLEPPFHDLECNDYSKYIVQQNLYKIMLKQVPQLSSYTLLPSELVWVTPFADNYYKIEQVPDRESDTQKLIDQYISGLNVKEWW